MDIWRRLQLNRWTPFGSAPGGLTMGQHPFHFGSWGAGSRLHPLCLVSTTSQVGFGSHSPATAAVSNGMSNVQQGNEVKTAWDTWEISFTQNVRP